MSFYAQADPASRYLLRSVGETVAVTVYSGETPTDADGPVSVEVEDHAGNVIVPSATAANPAGAGTYSVAVPPQALLTVLTATWSGTFSGSPASFTTRHEVVGGLYATPAEVRQMDALADVDAYPTARIYDGIDWAADVIERYTGASFVRRFAVVYLAGETATALRLGHLFPSRLLSVKSDGVAEDVTGWGLTEDGVLTRATGVFPYSTVGPNVEVAVEYGITETPPPDIAWAARTLARQYVVDLVSRVPDRALSMTTEFGQVMLAQAGGPGRPTSLPEVNAVLNRHRHRPPMIV